MYKLLTILLMSVLCGLAFGAEVKVNAFFEPKEATRGGVVNYQVIIEGTQSGMKGALPRVDGLSVVSQAASNQLQIVNGKTTAYVIYTYLIKVQKEGEYEMPAFEVTVDGEKKMVPGAKLVVRENGQGEGNGIGPEIARLEVSGGDKSVYVGQYVPIEIVLKTHPKVSGQILKDPAQGNDAFSDFGYKGQQASSETVSENGMNYSALRWKTMLAPLKSGMQKVEYKVDVAIHVPGQRAKLPTVHDMMSGQFSSLLHDLFETQSEHVGLYSKAFDLEVKGLPEVGKPNDFSGGIGKFKVSEAVVDHMVVEVGEPITLKFSVEGTGNFTDIGTPAMELGDGNWKVYPPKVLFEGKDGFNYEGKKTFEYILIAQKEGNLLTPEVKFNYFNPEKGQYREKVVKGVSVEVKGGNVNLSQRVAPEKPAEKIDIEKETENAVHFVPIKLSIGKRYRGLEPIFLNKWFYIVQLVPLLILVVVYRIGKERKRLREDVEYFKSVEKGKALHDDLKKIRHAYSSGDINIFYEAAVNAVQDAIGFEINSNPHSLTLNEIKKYMDEKGVVNELKEEVREIFESADLLKFGGSGEEMELTKERLNRVEQLIEKLRTC